MPADRRARVALLECDHVPQALRAVGDDYGTMFISRFDEHAPQITFERFDVIGGQPLPRIGDHDGYLVTGSRHAVTDALPWIEDLRRFITATVEADLPVVGICFGHQLLAAALGGRVERAAAGWGVGVHPAEVLAHRPWMDPRLNSFNLLVSHQDQVVELPPDGRLLAAGPHAPISAFEAGPAVGFQGHPEFDPPFSAALMEARRDRIPANVLEVGHESLSQPTDHATVVGWLGNFLARGTAGDAAARADSIAATEATPQAVTEPARQPLGS